MNIAVSNICIDFTPPVTFLHIAGSLVHGRRQESYVDHSPEYPSLYFPSSLDQWGEWNSLKTETT